MSEQRPANQIAATWLPTDPPRQAPPLLTNKEAATLLRLDAADRKNPVRNLETCRKNGLKSCYVGGYVRYPLAEVLRFIQSEMENNPR